MTDDILVSFRIDPKLKSAAQRRAKRDDLNFSDIVRILLKAYAKGKINVKVNVRQKK